MASSVGPTIQKTCSADASVEVQNPGSHHFPAECGRAAVARQVLVVPAMFCVANCCCRGRKRTPITHVGYNVLRRQQAISLLQKSGKEPNQ